MRRDDKKTVAQCVLCQADNRVYIVLLSYTSMPSAHSIIHKSFVSNDEWIRSGSNAKIKR